MLEMRCKSFSNPENHGLHNTPVFPELTNVHIPTYLTAYADGEGCFCVSICKSSKHRNGWEVRPSFSVSQNADRAEILFLYISTFGCGNIRPDRSDNTLKYEVRSLARLLDVVIPHFEKFPLLSSKNISFQLFKEVCGMMFCKDHLSESGLKEIVEISGRLNASGKRKYVCSGNKEIVSAISNNGIKRSSGPHETHNDLSTLLTMNSVKLNFR